jgi:hypothetical protein
MPFKYNSSKKIEPETLQMLDTKHKKITEQFEVENTILIPKLLNELKTSPNKDSIQKKINDIQKNQINYYLLNSSHIFSYFEEKKDISECKSKITIVNNFFNIDKIQNGFKQMSKHSVQYLKNIGEFPINSEDYVYSTSVCSKCKQGELIQVDYEGAVICNNKECACQFQMLVENERSSYKEPPKEVCFYAYKRINHFKEILAQFQAKETTQIPNDIIENIKLQIKKERLDIETMTNKKTKEILKKFGYNKYYEHIPFIKEKLGIKPPIMSPDLEEKLCSLFMEIQRPYAKFCPDDRVNFLNYYYTIYKLCELLGEDQFLPYFPMLKDRGKKIEQDEIWKKICDELNWQFISTI